MGEVAKISKLSLSLLPTLFAKWVSKLGRCDHKQACTFRNAYNFVTQDEVLRMGGRVLAGPVIGASPCVIQGW